MCYQLCIKTHLTGEGEGVLSNFLVKFCKGECMLVKFVGKVKLSLIYEVAGI